MAAVARMEKQGLTIAFGRATRNVSTIGLSQIAALQFLPVDKPRNWIKCGQAGPLCIVVVADPAQEVVAISGDYDFQLLIEALAVGAQLNLPQAGGVGTGRRWCGPCCRGGGFGLQDHPRA